jgi:hypothetical protein
MPHVKHLLLSGAAALSLSLAAVSPSFSKAHDHGRTNPNPTRCKAGTATSGGFVAELVSPQHVPPTGGLLMGERNFGAVVSSDPAQRNRSGNAHMEQCPN